MAPVRESTYFPPLDKCLDGRHQLLSWRTTYAGLQELENGVTYDSLEKHLTDSHTLELLKQSFSSAPPPTSQTRPAFETKTSAINLVPSARGRYDIKQIQSDSLWLSAEAQIDEIAALRIVVLEWQTRPAAQLQESGLAADISGRSFNGGISLSAYSASRSLLRSRILPESSADPDDANNSDARRSRLFSIYLAECRFRLETCRFIVFTALCKSGADRTSFDKPSGAIPAWVESVGHEILTAWDIYGVSKITGRNILLSGIDALQSRLKRLEEGCGWFRDKEQQEHIQVAWCECQILESLAVMETILFIVGSFTQVPRSGVINSWFRLMSDYGFFEVFEPPFRELYNTHDWQLQSLTSLISLAILRLPAALHLVESLSAMAASTADPSGSAAYLNNPDVCNEVTEILVNAASECLRVASPAVLAWSIILQAMREHALQSRETRDTRQLITVVDGSAAADSSDNQSTDHSSTRVNRSLRRHSSTGSDTPQQQTVLDVLLESILLVGVDGDPIAFLARAAVDGSHVLDIIVSLSVGFCTPFGTDHKGKSGMKMRHLLLELIKSSLDLIDYQPDLIQATLAVLTGAEGYWESLDRPLGYRAAEPASIFLEDKIFMDKLFHEALRRFPYETAPFFRLCRALAVGFGDQGGKGMPAIWPMLANSNFLTCALPTSFTAYRVIRDDEEESTCVQLTANLELFRRQGDLQTRVQKRAKHDGSLISTDSMNLRQIPPGATGRVLSEAKPLVVYWEHCYSPWAYLGMLLQSASSEDPVMAIGPNRSGLILGLIPDIIDLLSMTLLTAIKGASAPSASISVVDATQNLLDTASEGLDGGQDIVSVVFDVFERELCRQPKSTEENPSSVLVRCVQFTHALLQVVPDRVWPFLGRSALLGVKNSNSQLGAVLASIESGADKYGFLVSCIRLFEALVDDAITHAISRKSSAKAVARFTSSQPLGAGVSQVVMKKVLLSFERIMLDVYQSVSTLGLVVAEQRCEVNARLSAAFHRLLTCCFGIEEQPDQNQKLSAPLVPSGEYLVDVFLSPSGSEAASVHLPSIIQEGGEERPDLGSPPATYLVQQTICTLRFTSTLLRLSTMLVYPRSRLQEQILGAVLMLTRTYTSHPGFRQPVVELLDVLVHNAGLTDSQPASLLGYMPEETAHRFLEVLLTLDEPLRDRSLSVSIWKLLSQVVSKRQQWLAIFILTGEAPRQALKREAKGSDGDAHADCLLNIALDSLSNIERLPPQTAAGVLEFVALSADSWPWILSIIQQHPHFMTAITKYVRQVETMSNTTQNRSSQAGMEYHKIQITSYITELLAMYTNYTRQNAMASYAKDLLPNLTYIISTAVVPPAFNASLQSILRQNFEARFENCSLVTFKRTAIKPPALGDSFYYDLDLAGQMLRRDPSWTGRDQNGFAAEIARANVNLSVVEAQISLFHSWRFLAVELSKSLRTDVEYQETMAEVVMDCLRTNAQNTLPQAIFERVAQSRADLAFTLLQVLIEAKSSRPNVKSVLFTAWDAMRAHGTDLTLVLDGDGASCCRTLLKILCLSIQAHASHASNQESTNGDESHPHGQPTRKFAANATLKTVLEILKVVVAHGFRSLTILLHDSPSRILPTDFALLAAILRNSLLIPSLDRHTTALLSAFAVAQTSRYASTLLSWSDQLATNRDPIYGELSINFLLEMSSMPALAESLAVEGILTHIANTNLIKYLRTSEGLGPFDHPPRMYNIWVRGILPLLLNLLHAVGTSMAAEIAVYLHLFQGQIARANGAFTFYSAVSGSEGYLTLSTVSEAQTLAVLTEILDTYREAGASAGVVSAEIMETGWERGRVREDVESWLQRRGALRERIVAVGEREEGWERMKASGGGAVNRLEEKVVEEMGVLLMLLGGKEE
ncbi:MAG: hypothetical protein LQ345_003748 [Seirophora villosa]|nr:MAG: hypothetical protein LQ345_003748 [Seirophora villosa]